ncbi:MAG: hypothetical protein IKP05_03710 [Alphaproteobacteria bacterium]|nr:hypothetical protein [Alphaproteobacteria bacterium]
MSSKLFEIFLEKASSEKIYADFTDMDKTAQNPNGFGVYDVRNSSVGPFMIDYKISGCKNDDFLRDTMTLRVPEMGIDNVCFGPFWPDAKPSKDFIALRNLVGNMKTRPSMMSYDEAIDKFMYCNATSYIRELVARKSAESRVIYDVVNQMISMGPHNTELRWENYGYNITVRFPNYKKETIKFMEYDTPSNNQIGKPPYALIEIPSANVRLMCGNEVNTNQEKMVYNQVKRYKEGIVACEQIAPETEDFGRFDVGYRKLMKHVLDMRESIKTK